MAIAVQYFLSQLSLSVLPPSPTCDVNKAATALQVNNSWASEQFEHFPFAMQRFAILPIKLPLSWANVKRASVLQVANGSGQRAVQYAESESRIRIQNPPKSQLQFNSTHSQTHSRTVDDSVRPKFQNLIEHSKTHWHVAVIGPKNAGTGWNGTPSWRVWGKSGGGRKSS